MKRIVISNIRRFVFVVFAFVFVLFYACNSRSNKSTQKNTTENENRISVETFKSGDGWGYQIKVFDKVKINQPNIPGVSGNLSFDTEMEARKVGEFVAKRMRVRSLPSVTQKDLDSLQIKY